MNTETKDGILEQGDKPQTACRDCAFAEFDGNSQTGCKLGKIEKFKQNGASVKEVFDETDKEYFVIDGRFCVFWRRPSWLKKNEVVKLGAEKAARKEVQARFAAVVHISESSSPKDVEKTVDSLLKQNPQPEKLVFANTSSIKPSKLVALGKHFSINLQIPKEKGCSYWKIEQIKEDDVDFSRAVDIAVKGLSANDQNYYCGFNAGFEVPIDFTNKIDSSINDDMNRFLLLTSENENGFVGQIHMHKSIGGNYGRNFVDKMKTVTEEQKCPHLIQKITDIVPSMTP